MPEEERAEVIVRISELREEAALRTAEEEPSEGRGVREGWESRDVPEDAVRLEERGNFDLLQSEEHRVHDGEEELGEGVRVVPLTE